MASRASRALSGEQLDAAMKTLNDRDFPVFDFARKLEAQVNELMGMLRARPPRFRTRPNSPSPANASRRPPCGFVWNCRRPRPRPPIRSAARSLRRSSPWAKGRNGIVEMRERDLTTLSEIAATLKTVDGAAAKMRGQVEALVGGCSRPGRRGEPVQRGADRGEWALARGNRYRFVAGALSLSLFYIRPAVIGRLNRLWARDAGDRRRCSGYRRRHQGQ